VKEAIGEDMARVNPVWIRNTDGNRTENHALFTLLSDRAQGYKFLYKDLEVLSVF
jgi:hypothetical protein